jgi:hypothetical protein
MQTHTRDKHDVRSGNGLSCELCTSRFEPKRQIIIANFERLVSTIGRLEAMTQANQAKMDANQLEMLAKTETNQ